MTEYIVKCDAFDHRQPKFPVGGYAPGGYIFTCRLCNEKNLIGAKRSYQCFPCAIETLVYNLSKTKQELASITIEHNELKNAIDVLKKYEK